MKSSDLLRPCMEKVLEDVDSRDPKYGLAWSEPKQCPLKYLDAKLQQKANGVAYIIGNGQIKERKAFLEELLLDLMGYSLMIYWRTINEDK